MVLFLLVLLRNAFFFLGGCLGLVCLIVLFVENRVQEKKVEKDGEEESKSLKRTGGEDGVRVGVSGKVESCGDERCDLGGEGKVFDGRNERDGVRVLSECGTSGLRGVEVDDEKRKNLVEGNNGLDVDKIVEENFEGYDYKGCGAGEVSGNNGFESEEKKNLVQEDGSKVVAGEVVIGSVVRRERSCAMEAWLAGASVALKRCEERGVGQVIRKSGVDDESVRLMEDDDEKEALAEDDHEKEELVVADCIGEEWLAQDGSEEKRLVEDEGESKMLIGDDNEKMTLTIDEDDCKKVFEADNEKTLADDEDEKRGFWVNHGDDKKGLVEDDLENKQLTEEEDNGFGHDDDWEGVERTELEKRFGAAVAYVGCKENAERVSKLSNYVQMQLYGLHKVATQGPCSVPQPKIFQVSARAKWNAWRLLGDMSPELAMEKYIGLLSENVPDWNGDDSHGAKGPIRRH